MQIYQGYAKQLERTLEYRSLIKQKFWTRYHVKIEQMG